MVSGFNSQLQPDRFQGWDTEKASHELQVDWIKFRKLVQKNEILEMQLENSKELKELKEQLAISHSQLAKERGTLVSQGKLEKRVKDDFQR